MHRGLFAALCLALAGAGQTAERTAYRDWELIQSADAGCLLRQVVLSRKSGIALLEAYVTRDPATARPVLSMLTANGVSLSDGIGYLHPGSRGIVPLAWQSCTPEVCTAQFLPDDAEWARLRQGTRIEVGYRPLPGRAAIVVPLSLMGLTAGWAALSAC